METLKLRVFENVSVREAPLALCLAYSNWGSGGYSYYSIDVWSGGAMSFVSSIQANAPNLSYSFSSIGSGTATYS